MYSCTHQEHLQQMLKQVDGNILILNPTTEATDVPKINLKIQHQQQHMLID